MTDQVKFDQNRENTAQTVFMVIPASFGFHPESASSNAFQTRPDEDSAAIAAAAREEALALKQSLQAAGVRVVANVEHSGTTNPDSVFPNNWISFHPGHVVLYPMATEHRRREVIWPMEGLPDEFNHLVDLTHFAQKGSYLEGTGSLVLDRTRRVAFAGVSLRTNPDLARQWAATLDYELVLFSTADEQGLPIYHTNVLLAIGPTWAVLGEDCILPEDRPRVHQRLLDLGKEVLVISSHQVSQFCGNILPLQSEQGENLIAMSQSAFDGFGDEGRAFLARHGRLIAAPIPTIEKVGGGSVRCCLCEVFPPRDAP
jgi:hypothetical protein